MSATATEMTWTADDVRVAGMKLHVRRAGAGDPLLVLHHDVGSLDRLPFYDALARRFTVYVPSHPGYDRSERPEWMRSARDIAVCYQWLLAELGATSPALVGLGFGGVKRNRLFMAASQSVYALYVEAQGAPGG